MEAEIHTPEARQRRRGFTIVESLMVLSTASVLLSLMIPGVQNARDSSRDQTCINRLKQMGLALHNYHDVFNGFPPAWTSRRGLGEGHPASGWQFSILPYLGEAKFYTGLNSDNIFEPRDGDWSPLKTEFAHYRCTSDSVGETNPLRDGWGTSNFSGNYGANPIPRWSASEFWPGQTRPSSSFTGRKDPRSVPNGFFEMNKSIKFRDIIDGTSNTICVGEKCVISRSGIWPGVRSNFHESDVVSDASHSSPFNRSETGFSSRHTSGVVYFTIGDGSVRPIHESVESLPRTDQNPHGGIMQLLAARNDGQVIRNRQDHF